MNGHDDKLRADAQVVLDDEVAQRGGAEAVVQKLSDCPLDDIENFLCRFVAYPNGHCAVAHTLWIAHTHGMQYWESTPRICFLSKEAGSGKTRALEVTEPLVPRPVQAVNVTPAYLFRKMGSAGGLPTVLYDETDTLFGPRAKHDNEDVRGLLNAGHRRSGTAGRCVVRGKQVFTEEIGAYCAVALAGLGDLPNTILTRSVIVRMRRRSACEPVTPWRRRLYVAEGEALRDRLAAWVERHAHRLENVFPKMPDTITDRDADVWEALIAIADAAGGDWPRRAREAAVALVADARQNTPSLGIRLLADLRTVFGEHDALPTEQILKELTAIEESPWGDLRGKPLDARGLAHRLKGYGIASKNVRIGEHVVKGYDRADLQDSWDRYLSVSHLDAATGATAATGPARVADVADVAHSMGEAQNGWQEAF